ncbi:MAG TPA: helix-turn-helix transcriptional regulator [Mobilitalea sp.]|nr:helix-turn-helix transcriptional regulator [Mobilitalea sp.]
MAIGERIKRIRIFRKMTQTQLGEAVGLSDVRIRQYEIGNRTPKDDMVQAMSKALDCNYRSIYEPTLYAAEDVMYTLFELDEHYNLLLQEIDDNENKGEKHLAVSFNYSLLDDFLSEWMKKKEELASGSITKEEYFEWKINWPDNNK